MKEETDSYERAVTTSVMPKGVEHGTAGIRFRPILFVTTSVMPKGVEHYYDFALVAYSAYGDYLCDAERR